MHANKNLWSVFARCHCISGRQKRTIITEEPISTHFPTQAMSLTTSWLTGARMTTCCSMAREFSNTLLTSTFHHSKLKKENNFSVAGIIVIINVAPLVLENDSSQCMFHVHVNPFKLCIYHLIIKD